MGIFLYLMVNKYTYFQIFLDDLTKTVTLAELEKYFGTPHQTVRRHIKPLVESGILTEEKKGRFVTFRVNRENPLVFDYISICEKQRLFEFLKKPLFSRLYMKLSEHFDNKIIMFGSAVKGEYNDIDILAIPGNVHKVLEDFSATYNKKIHLVNTKESELTETFLKEIRKKHVIFNEHDFFVRLLYDGAKKRGSKK